MSKHPLNLSLRFALEIAAILLTAYWGWENFSGPIRIATVIFIPLLLMTLWGGFRYPKDHGKGFKKVSGKTRLAIEAFVLSVPIVLNFSAGNYFIPLIFFSFIVFHYILSQDRLQKMLHEK